MFLTVKVLVLLLITVLLFSCIQSVKKQIDKVSIQDNLTEGYVDRTPCPPDTLSFSIYKDKLLEEILKIYINKEGLKTKTNFLEISSGCWSDSTYFINFSHYEWGNLADSLVFLDASKVSSFKGFSICLNILNSTFMPLPNQLKIEGKNPSIRSEETFFLFNEYFNNITVIYYPKGGRVLDVYGSNKEVESYKELFKMNEYLKRFLN